MIKHGFISTLAFLAAVAGVQAGELGQHPALRSAGGEAAVDASAIMIGHPAGGRTGKARANADHPAVISARLSARTQIDPNTYLVQPPATTQWTLGPAASEMAVAKNSAR